MSFFGGLFRNPFSVRILDQSLTFEENWKRFGSFPRKGCAYSKSLNLEIQAFGPTAGCACLAGSNLPKFHDAMLDEVRQALHNIFCVPMRHCIIDFRTLPNIAAWSFDPYQELHHGFLVPIRHGIIDFRSLSDIAS